jgi:hypothetical protein
MLRTYRIDGVAHLVNETYDQGSRKRGAIPRRRAWSFQPGDIVRNQLFEGDASDLVLGPFPVGLVVWCADDGSGSAIGVLWSGDPEW